MPSKGDRRWIVLLLSTYPCALPRHGGQVRLLNIKRAYEAAGWHVLNIAVYDEQSYSPEVVGPLDILFPVSSTYRNVGSQPAPLASDLLSGDFAVAMDGALREIYSRTPTTIDCVHAEQPWLWPVVDALKRRQGQGKFVTVYGSENIEAPLKHEIFRQMGIKTGDELVKRVAELEVRAAREADLTLAVSQQDANEIEKWKPKRLALAMNGIEPWVAPSEAKIKQWSERLPKFPWLLYVASAHPPNFSHFLETFRGSLACVPPVCRIVVAGQVSQPLYRTMAASVWSSLNLSRLELVFALPDEDLDALKTLAHGFVLPIGFGGGTNIKTAEALYSGAHVIATPAACRGYEDFLDLPEVRIGRSPEEFQRAVSDVLQAPPAERATPGTPGWDRRQRLTWQSRLSALPAIVSDIATSGAKSGLHLV